jgi:hypothetical protein
MQVRYFKAQKLFTLRGELESQHCTHTYACIFILCRKLFGVKNSLPSALPDFTLGGWYK